MPKPEVVGGVPRSSDPAGWNEVVAGRKQAIAQATGLHLETNEIALKP